MKNTLFRLVLFAAIFVQAFPATGKPPNIVFILADDMSFDSISANNEKIGNMKTPCLDKLIAQGMNFTDAHSASSVCTPTRYGLLTGRYAWRTELKSEVLWQWAAPLVEKDRLTVAELLQAKGYTTGMVGKWHLGFDWYDTNGKMVNNSLKITDAFHKKGEAAERLHDVASRIDFSKPISGGPTDHGFDYFFGVDLPNFAPYAWIENDKVQGIPSATKPDGMFGTPGPMLPGWKLEGILPTLALKAENWITTQSNTNKPFFLYLPLTSPHTPIAPSPAFLGKSGISKYADFVIETDWVVGHISKALENAGVAENTILIFSTDNGTAAAANFKKLEAHGVDLHNHYKGHKGQIHEGGHRIPFIVRWPGVVRSNSTCDQTVCLNDFMSTVADLLEVQLPDNAAEDSYSILGLINGSDISLSKRPMVVNHDYRGRFAIRNREWKLVEGAERSLFDLRADIKETKNVVNDHPDVADRMSATLKQYIESGRSTTRRR